MTVNPSSPEEAPAPPASTVSREKVELRILPRNSIQGSRRRPVFGRGFFRRFVSLGGAALVYLALLGIGAALFLFGLAGTAGPYEEALRGRLTPRGYLYAMGIGVVFFLLVLRALQVDLNRRWKGPERPRDKGERKEPWNWDYPWSTSWMAPDGEIVDVSTLGLVTFFAFVALSNALWLSGEPFFYVFLAFLDLLALAILAGVLRKLFQAVRFRRPVVIWEEIPVHPGGALKGRIAFPRDVRATGPARLTLRCVREQRDGAEDNDVFAVYRETREIPLPGEPGEPLDVLSFSFQVPRDLPGTSLVKKEPIYWQVVAEVPVAGPDLEVAFLAPVYQKRG